MEDKLNESLLQNESNEELETEEDQTEEVEVRVKDKEELEINEKAVKPEGLGDEFWDEEKGSVNSDKLLEAFKKEQDKALGLRRKLSEKGSTKPPKDAKEYTLDESLNDLMPEESPALSILRNNALDSGLSKDQFNNFLSKVLPQLKEEGLIAQNETELSEEEREAQFQEYKEKELEKLGKDGKKVLEKVSSWSKGLVNLGIMSRDELPILESFASDAESLVVLNKIIGLTGEKTIPTKTAVVDGLPSQEEIDQIMSSQAYADGDAKLVKKVEEYYNAVYAQ